MKRRHIDKKYYYEKKGLNSECIEELDKYLSNIKYSTKIQKLLIIAINIINNGHEYLDKVTSEDIYNMTKCDNLLRCFKKTSLFRSFCYMPNKINVDKLILKMIDLDIVNFDEIILEKDNDEKNLDNTTILLIYLSDSKRYCLRKNKELIEHLVNYYLKNENSMNDLLFFSSNYQHIDIVNMILINMKYTDLTYYSRYMLAVNNNIIPYNFDVVKDSCCICLDVLDDNIVMGPCSHVIHKDCVIFFDEYLSCPLCRQISSKNIWKSPNYRMYDIM